ncbi:MAG: AAA domain-containing protein [Bacteroidetes bacterium]|jgi:DNA-binding NtrC family response regulator|nr:AAA domain-containing protein [Bacteroidota bacterium]
MDREAIQERFGIVGRSQALMNVIDRVRQVARTDITVLVEGESGVGKELIAEAIHELSPRRHEAFVIVNCGAIPEGLIESELFGAEKGAYTGATEQRTGYFEDADGGTVFLDEIGEMPQAAQVRLLRVLESGQFSRVGSSQVRTTDTRIIAATNKDLAEEVQAGRFREDLYYRLSTVLIDIPPLRERKEDILPIFERFLHRYAQKYNSSHRELDQSAIELLQRYHWPGNVRELRNVAEQCVVLLRKDTVTPDDLRPFLRGVTSSSGSSNLLPVARSAPGDSSDTRERELVYRALIELRHEMSELKGQIGKLVAALGVAVPREAFDRGDMPGERSDYVLLGESKSGDYASFIEDVVYEIENGDDGPSANGGPGRPGAASVERSPEPEPEPEEESIPTLEDAERELITKALKRFDGNRRQTAKALGISERTLYRKLKELDEDL